MTLCTRSRCCVETKCVEASLFLSDYIIGDGLGLAADFEKSIVWLLSAIVSWNKTRISPLGDSFIHACMYVCVCTRVYVRACLCVCTRVCVEAGGGFLNIFISPLYSTPLNLSLNLERTLFQLGWLPGSPTCLHWGYRCVWLYPACYVDASYPLRCPCMHCKLIYSLSHVPSLVFSPLIPRDRWMHVCGGRHKAEIGIMFFFFWPGASNDDGHKERVDSRCSSWSMP